MTHSGEAKELAQVPTQEQVRGVITQQAAKLTLEDVATIKATIFPGCNDSEMKLFLHDCQRNNVHPLDRMIHPTVRTDRKTGQRKYTAITSIDLMRSRAEDTGAYAGNDDPIIKGDVKSGNFEAKVIVYKIVQGIRCPFDATARWSEYKPQEGSDFMYNRMPCLMLGKCAEALALRKAFPKQLHGLYAKEEMQQASEPLVIAETPVVDKPAQVVDRRIKRCSVEVQGDQCLLVEGHSENHITKNPPPTQSEPPASVIDGTIDAEFTPAPKQDEPPKRKPVPTPKPPDDGASNITINCVVTDIKEKTGQKANGEKWTLYGVKLYDGATPDGFVVNTFSDTLASTARTLMGEKAEAVVTYKIREYQDKEGAIKKAKDLLAIISKSALESEESNG